jgi:hypothetical protein
MMWSIVPFCPGGAEDSGFLPASTLDVMEAHHDLRKFITELAVAQRRHVLSSGREASASAGPVRTTAQDEAVPAMWITLSGAGVHRDSINVGRLTLGAGIESSTAMGSDLWAAEALQEAETEVGVGVMIDRGRGRCRAGSRRDRPDRLTRRPISALRPES